jgi:dTDP-4-amino-4,6-dideoxygalactose transaminase
MTGLRKVAFGKPWITDAERNAVLGVLAGDVLTHGPQAHAFEAEFAAFMGEGAHCLTTSSGMAALHLAYWQLGIGPGDEVIVPAQTHVATVHAVEYVGAQPVFADCDRDTGNMDPSKIEALITPRTRAIGIVHFLGIACDMPAIMAIAERHGLKVIEDCALAIGTRLDGRHAGLFGDAAIFSFYPVKHITTGDGGMFVSRHSELTQKVAKARAFGVDRSFGQRSTPGLYDVPTLGLNYRLSDINSAIGREQLKRIDAILSARRDNFTRLKDAISGIPNVSVIDTTAGEHTNSHYCLSVVLDGPLAAERNDVIARLNAAGVGTSVYYPHPIPRLAYYREKYNLDLTPYANATRISDQSVALPVGPHLVGDDIDYIAATFTKVIKELTCSPKN